jgi:hypothetical protein
MPLRLVRRRRPLLLLDVDGVFNPLGDCLPEGFTVHAGAYDNFMINTGHGRWILELGERFEIVWATAREDEVNFDVGPALGLPTLPVITFTQSWDSTRTWKLPDIAAYVGDRPFCWIDDDILPDALAWAARREAPTLLIPADPKIGFTATHRDAMHAFADGLTA